jgi:hypothetical protein
MWPGTRSEPANLAAIHRGHKPRQTWCCTRPHIRRRPRLVRQERKLQRRLQSKQSGSLWRLLVVLVARVKLAPRILFLCSDPSCRRLTRTRTRTPRLRNCFPQTKLLRRPCWRRPCEMPVVLRERIPVLSQRTRTEPPQIKTTQNCKET